MQSIIEQVLKNINDPHIVADDVTLCIQWLEPIRRS